MSTFESKEIICTMLLNDGVYEGDPAPVQIWQYTHRHTGSRLFAVFYNTLHNDLHVAPNVQTPILLWRKPDGLTDQGKLFLATLGYSQDDDDAST